MRRVLDLSRCGPLEDRYTRLMDLARRVRGLETMPDTPTLRLLVRTWNAESWDRATDRWERELWPAFLRYFRKVKHPTGKRLRDAVEVAKAAPAPAWAGGQYGGEPGAVLLVKLCRVLGWVNAGRPFPLSVRTASESVGVSYRAARDLLEWLRADGVLELAVKGVPGKFSRQASYWRYVGRSAPGATNATAG